MHPILIDFGFFELASYGLLLVVATVVALFTLKIRADANGLDGALHVDFAIWLVIWALVGSRVLLILNELPRYLHNPAELLGLLRAGGVFLGGFIAALIAAVILLRRYKLEFLPTTDVIVPSLALGHAVGRIGCLLAGCCWGSSCDLPWSIIYRDQIASDRLGTPLHVSLHPFPVYSFLFNFGLYLVLAWLYKKSLKPGRVLATYLFVYGIGRFLLEYTRGDRARGLYFDDILSTSQLISIVMILAGAGLHLWLQRRRQVP
jgi:phosphatidylglycerol:prolipoprotein diacylglycerol transferase